MLHLQTLAQDTLTEPVDYDVYTTSMQSTDSASMFLSGPWIIASLVITVITTIAMWRIFTKAGEQGWKAIVPVYNLIVLLRLVGRPTWWAAFLLLMFIPVVGSLALLVLSIIVSHDLSKSFGKNVGMTVLLVLLPFIGFPLLAWGDAKYQGPAALGEQKKEDGELTDVLGNDRDKGTPA